MKKNLTGKAVTSALLLVAFVVFTLAVATVDVTPAGLEGTDIGLSGINIPVRDALGFNETLYKLSELLGYLALLVMAAAALTGLYQLVKGKSLKAVEPEILLTGGYYVVVLAVYLLFEKVSLKYRPVDLGEGLEASFPSSHTVLALSVFLAAVLLVSTLFAGKKKLVCAVSTVLILLAAATVICRLLSGVHWFTDIIGGVILSAFLLSLYSLVRSLLPGKE